jgi:hypothetical protein
MGVFQWIKGVIMYVAIIKRVSELNEKSDVQSKLPDQYPSLCVEGENEEELAKLYPGATIMPVEQYKGYQKALSELYEDAAVSASKTIWDRLKFW